MRRAELLIELAERAQAARGHASEELRGTLSSYSDELLHRIEDATTSSDHHPHTLRFVFTLINDGRSESFMSDVLTYLPLLNTGARWVEGMIESLLVYRQYSWFPQDRRPDLKQRRIIVSFLITVHEAIDELDIGEEPDDDGTLKLHIPSVAGREHWVMTDERVIRFIFEHPDEADRIIQLVKERCSVHYDVIHAVLTNPAPALSEGVL